MPDWSYHTLFRPLLFLLPAERARDLTLSAIGLLGRFPGGPSVIEFMGHMKPPEELAKKVGDVAFPTPVGLGAGLDVDAKALGALSRFGFGFVELGPVTRDPIPREREARRDEREQSILYPDPLANPGLDVLESRLEAAAVKGVALGARLGFRPGSSAGEAAEERLHMMKKLSSYCHFFTLDTREQVRHSNWTAEEWQEQLNHLIGSTDCPVFITISPDLTEQEALQILQPAYEAGVNGLLVAGGMQASSTVENTSTFTLTGIPSREPSRKMVEWARKRWPQWVIIGSGGIHEPADALKMMESGADFVQLHSGLVFSGPGLAKRINEAIWQTLECQESPAPTEASKPSRWIFASWIWGVLLGLGMIIGGIFAWLVAATSVVLPYDERFLGASATELDLINEQLLPFMSHDRISLAGTMISIGVIYYQLARFGLRHGLHWTRQILLISGAVGFGSFFLFLGYGYLDYMHAALSFMLFPAFLLALKSPAKLHLTKLPPQLHNDRDWKRALWGQLLFVIIGFGLTAAGIVISCIGVTRVFVPSDLAFLCASTELLQAYNDRLIPLIAHDRAGFGGALVSDGLAVLTLCLWGFRQGESWIWWTLLLAGLPGFVSGIGIHFAVGYVDFLHLFPAYAAALLFLVGLVLTRPFLVKRPTGCRY